MRSFALVLLALVLAVPATAQDLTAADLDVPYELLDLTDTQTGVLANRRTVFLDPGRYAKVIFSADIAGSYLAKPLSVGGRIGVGVERQPIALRFGYSYGQEFWAGTTLNAVSLSAGGASRVGRLHLAALAGPAIVWGTDALPRHDERHLMVGAVVEASALLTLAGALSFGGEIHANVNGVANSLGGGPVVRIALN